jgi:c-di-GMP-related signal transduction protein
MLNIKHQKNLSSKSFNQNLCRSEIFDEGVETEGQKEMLTELNCHFFQGFLISKPIKANDFCQQFLQATHCDFLGTGASLENFNE